MRCSDQPASDPVSHQASVDCDTGSGAHATDLALRRASSLPEDSPSAPQNSSTSPLSTSCQGKVTAGSRSGSGGIVAERVKRLSEGANTGKTSTSPTGHTSPSSRCSRSNSAESPSHGSEYCIASQCILLLRSSSRVPTPPGKSWNVFVKFPDLESPGK